MAFSAFSEHPRPLSTLLNHAWHSVSETAFATAARLTWTPFSKLAEATAISFLSNITVGELRIITPSGQIYTFPDRQNHADEVRGHQETPTPDSPRTTSLTNEAQHPLETYPGHIDSGSSDTDVDSVCLPGSGNFTPAAPQGIRKGGRAKVRSDNVQASDFPRAKIRVMNETFWIRLCTMGDLGFGEAYMYGEVECDDLVGVFELFLANKETLTANLNTSLIYVLGRLPQKLISSRFANTLGNARSNISAHYDISNDMFAGFLSKDMTYSCAIFDNLDGDLGTCGNTGSAAIIPTEKNYIYSSLLSPALDDPAVYDDLEAAQWRKLDHIIRKAHILPGQRVLEIGSGWGSLAIRIAQIIPGVMVDTLTLSHQQQKLARERVKAAGFGPNEETGKDEKIRVHLMDYRSMPDHWKGAFDRVVSVEMLEAVGLEFMETYWRIVDWALKEKDAVGVIQVITLPEARLKDYLKEIDFIRKWIFPGGCLPTLTLLIQSLTSGSQGRLVVDSVCNIGPHYARTLREWRRRFEDHFEKVIVPALQREYPEVMSRTNGQTAIEVFRRKWIYYYCYCEVGFTTRTLGDHIITFTREGYQGYGCNIYD